MLFHRFDKVMMLAAGKLVYFGSPEKSVKHLVHHGVMCPEGYTDADYWTHLLESGTPTDDAANRRGDTDGSEHEEIVDSCDESHGNNEETTFSCSSLGSEVLSAPIPKEPYKFRRSQSTPIPRTVAVPDRNEGVEGNVPIFSRPTVKKAHTTRKKRGPPTSGSPLQYLIGAWDNEAMALRIDNDARRPTVATEFSKGKRKSKRTSWAVFQLDEVIRSSIRGSRKDESSPANEVHKDVAPCGPDEGEKGEKSKRDHRTLNTSWWTQYDVLLHRALKESRFATFTKLNLVKTGALGLLVGMAYFQRDYSEVNVFDISSYCFLTQVYFVLAGMFETLLAYPNERQVVLKERANHSYHLSAYVVAKMTSELPIRMILPFLYALVSFWMTGMSSRFDIFLFTPVVALLGGIAGDAIGLAVAAIARDVDQGVAVLTVLSMFMLLVGGFFVQNIPDSMGWTRFLSPFKYSYDASCLLVFDGDIPCDGSGALGVLCGGEEDAEKMMVSSKDVLDFLNVEGTLRFNVGVLLVWAIIPRYLAFRAMLRHKEPKQ
jgi:ABC-type multidrug transport system permease subunit